MLCSINPLYKFVGITLPLIILAFTHNVILNIFIVLLAIILMLLSKIPPKAIVKILIPLTILAIGLFITGYKFTTSTKDISAIFINPNVTNGLQLSTRIFSFSLLGMCFVKTTNHMEFIHALEQQTKIPNHFIYGFFASFQLLPQIQQEYKKKKLAFQVRGIAINPISPKLIALVLVKAIQWSEVLSGAMESRGFGITSTRSHYQIIITSRKDKWFPFIMTSGIVFLVLLQEIDLLYSIFKI